MYTYIIQYKMNIKPHFGQNHCKNGKMAIFMPFSRLCDFHFDRVKVNIDVIQNFLTPAFI